MTDTPTPLWASLDLLDRQVVDADGTPVGKVDDLELHAPDGGPPVVTALLSGLSALGPRLGGALGAAIGGAAQRLRPDDAPVRRIPLSLVAAAGPSIALTTPAAAAGLVPPMEEWLRRNVIGPLPGSGDAPR